MMAMCDASHVSLNADVPNEHAGCGLSVIAAPVPQVEVPEAIRRRQATQTIATAPEPVGWLVRTEWSAQLRTIPRDHLSVGSESQVSSSVQQGQQQAWFADPRKGTVMSFAETQQQFPHLQMVSSMGDQNIDFWA